MFDSKTYRELGLSRTGRAKARRRSVLAFLKLRHIPGLPVPRTWTRWEHLLWNADLINYMRRELGEGCEHLLIDEAGFQAYRRGLGGYAIDSTIAAILPAFTEAEKPEALAAIYRGYKAGRDKLTERRAPAGVTREARRQIATLADHMGQHYPRYWNTTAGELATLLMTSPAHAARLINTHQLQSGRVRFHRETGRRPVRIFHIRTIDVFSLRDRLEREQGAAPIISRTLSTPRIRAIVKWAIERGGAIQRRAQTYLASLGATKDEIDQLFKPALDPP